MSFNDPDSCGFAKVAAYNIVRSLNDHESHYEKYGLLFAELENFKVSYKQFNENTSKTVPLLQKLAKRNSLVKKEALSTFSEERWLKLAKDDKAKHSLLHCSECSNNLQFNQVLSKFPVNKAYRAGANVSKDLKLLAVKNRKALTDVTNQDINKLNKKYKSEYKFTFTDALNFCDDNKQKDKKKNIKTVNKKKNRILKTKIKKDIENSWSTTAVEM